MHSINADKFNSDEELNSEILWTTRYKDRVLHFVRYHATLPAEMC